MMTNKEMGDKIIASLGTPMGCSMSKEGIFLKIGDDSFEVTEKQAEILWDLLPQIAGANAEAARKRRSDPLLGDSR